MADPCDLPILGDSDLCHAAGTIGAAINFAQDPLGYIAQKMQEAANGLASTVLPAMEQLTHPDLSKDWFISAYRVSFALAVLVWAAFLGWNFVQLSRRRISGDDLVESLAFYTPAFFIGVIFGPLAGTTLLALTGALSDSLTQWGVAGSVKATTSQLEAAITAGNSDKIAGGSIVAILVFLCLIIALIMVFAVLLVMTVTLYLAGAVFPLSAAWLVHPRQRGKGLRIALVWIGVNCAHVLIFLLLGVAFRMVGGLGTDYSDSGLQILANLFIAVIALVMAVTAPFGLLAFAPVGPSSASASDPFPPTGGRGATGGGYEELDDDSQTAQMARDSGPGGEYDDWDDEEYAGSGGGGGGLMGTMSAREAAESSASMEADSTSGEGSAGESASPAGPAGDAVGDVAGDVAAVGKTAAVAAATGGAGGVAAAAGAAQAGSEDDADSGGGDAGGGGGRGGLGALIGAGMRGDAAVLGVAGTALSATAELAASAGDTAVEQMEHAYPDDEGGSGADARSGR
jgi:type IV secretion system protein TrbL